MNWDLFLFALGCFVVIATWAVLWAWLFDVLMDALGDSVGLVVGMMGCFGIPLALVFVPVAP